MVNRILLLANTINMLNYTFITLYILSIGLIFYIFLLFYAIIYDRHFNFVINNEKKLIKLLLLLLSIIGLLSYIFNLRRLARGRLVNCYNLLEHLLDFLEYLRISDIMVLSLFLIICLIFWVLLFRWIYQYIRCVLLALHLYFSQYHWYEICCSFFIQLIWDFHYYFWLRIRNFTHNHTVGNLALALWPTSIKLIEKIIFRYLLVYLILFDLSVNAAQISLLFSILPWFYLYSVFRGVFTLWHGFQIPENNDLSIEIYGYGTRFISDALKRKEVFWNNKIVLELYAKFKLFTELAMSFSIIFCYIFIIRYWEIIVDFWVKENQNLVFLQLVKFLILLWNLGFLLRKLDITKPTIIIEKLLIVTYQGFFCIYENINIVFNRLGERLLKKYLLVYEMQRKIIAWFLNCFNFDYIFMFLITFNLLPRTIFVLCLCYDVLFSQKLYYTFLVLPTCIILAYVDRIILFLLRAYIITYEGFLNSILIKIEIRDNQNYPDGTIGYQYNSEFVPKFGDIQTFYYNHYEILLRLKHFVTSYRQWKYEKFSYVKYSILLCIFRIICFLNIIIYGIS